LTTANRKPELGLVVSAPEAAVTGSHPGWAWALAR
jgi:hypothetical protein